MLFGKNKAARKAMAMSAVDNVLVERMLNNVSTEYANKSSDEYKSKGDIRKLPQYAEIEYDIAKLSSIKGLSENDIKAIKDLFNTLHRPIFPKMVAEYLEKPNERNIVFTATYSSGYKVLIGELARIEASTKATDKGLKYDPDKVSKNSNMIAFIKIFNESIDKRIDDAIKSAAKVKAVTESAVLETIVGAGNLAVGMVELVFGVFNNIFSSAKSLNPIALMSAILSRSYDKKVAAYEKIHREYEAAQKAYDEYKKIPEAQRKKRIEHKYVKMIEKYNIKMGNLKAEIDHYDERAQEHIKDASKNASKPTTNNGGKENKNLPQSNSTVDTSKDDKTSNSSSDDIDF